MRHHTPPLLTETPLGSLPTSRSAPQQITAVMAVLRQKAPRRPLSRQEARQIAEWQAQSLLEMGRIGTPPVPSTLVSELPRIVVAQDNNLPVSGCLQWRSGRWMILLNGTEPPERQRFSLAHEFKHSIDHRYAKLHYVDRPGDTARAQAEYAADWFAACLLMPRTLVKRAWASGIQDVDELARTFAVSPRAMTRRLHYLGLRTLEAQGGTR